MGSTLTPATVTFNLTGTVTISGKEFSTSNTWTVATEKDPFHFIQSIPTAGQTILLFSATPAAGTIGTVNTILIHNLDNTNYLTVGIKKTGAETAYFKIDAGKSFIITNTKLDIDAAGGAFGAFVDWDTITLQANTAVVDAEIFAV